MEFVMYTRRNSGTLHYGLNSRKADEKPLLVADCEQEALRLAQEALFEEGASPDTPLVLRVAVPVAGSPMEQVSTHVWAVSQVILGLPLGVYVKSNV